MKMNRKNFIILLIATAVMFIILLLPNPDTLPVAGQRALAVLALQLLMRFCPLDHRTSRPKAGIETAAAKHMLNKPPDGQGYCIRHRALSSLRTFVLL